MKKMFLSAMLSLIVILSSLPLAGQEVYAESTVGISPVTDKTYTALGLDTDSTELVKQANDELTPYGRGNVSLLARHELMRITGQKGAPQDITLSGNTGFGIGSGVLDTLKSAAKSSLLTYDFTANNAVRSVAFDPFGSGKPNFVAAVSALNLENGQTEITLSIDTREKNSNNEKIPSLKARMSVLPFKVYPENAGAWLSIAAGNFDGDPLNTQEIAVYRPYAGLNTYGDKTVMGGTIEVFKVEKNIVTETKIRKPSKTLYGPVREQSKTPVVTTVESFSDVKLVSAGIYDLRTEVSKYYFLDNELVYQYIHLSADQPKSDWTYQYLFPALSLEAVTQPGDSADDLCVTFTAALGGGVAKKASGFEFNAKRPYDSATGVFFWIDPLTAGQKNSGVTQMRYNWNSNYKVSANLDKDAAKKNEIMVFGSPGAGDIDNDGYQEVVVAGYAMSDRNQTMDGKDKGDWKISQDEYLASYFTYDPDRNTYARAAQAANWVSIKKGDYANASALGEGIYSNYGGKDMVHSPLPVTCFAERGQGNAESVAIGGIICTLDTESGKSKRVTSSKLSGYGFDLGAFNPRYAIPTESIHSKFGHSVQNRLISESVAGNFDGNTFGQEQLAFTYTVKQNGTDNQYSCADGIIAQRVPTDVDNVENIKDSKKNYLGDGVRFMSRVVTIKDKGHAPISVCAADTDNDSVIMRFSGEPNEYFFSEPHILAVLQASPYFKELDYTDAGETSIEQMEGTSSESEHGLTVGLQIQAGKEFKFLGNGSSFKVGVASEFERTWGSGNSKTYSLAYAAGLENSVALVMTPYVRYHYETYNPDTGVWSPMTVDTPQSPRASIITVSKYDAVAKQQKWETIGDNVLKNTAGVPASYGSSTAGKTDFEGAKAVGAGTATNFVKAGSGDSAGSMAQSISAENTKFVNMSWSVKEVLDVESVIGGVTLAVNQSAGYTGASTSANFDGYTYVGEVTNIPDGNENYSFSWQFGAWQDSVKVLSETQSFPVLGYLVKDVMQPPVYPETLHVAKASPNEITLAWTRPLQLQQGQNGAYTLYRYQHDVYYPLVRVKDSEGKDGFFSFTDIHVAPFSEYLYSLKTHATVLNQPTDSLYSPLLHAYTPPVGNIPTAVLDWGASNENERFTISSNEAAKPRSLKVKVTPAEGNDVGGVILQWQYYEQDGGWNDVAGYEATTDTLSLKSDAVGNEYRCRVSQRVGTEIYTVYTETVKPETMPEKKTSSSVAVYNVNVISNGNNYEVYRTASEPDSLSYVDDNRSYAFPAGTSVTLRLQGDRLQASSTQLPGMTGVVGLGGDYTTYTFTMPASQVDIDIQMPE